MGYFVSIVVDLCMKMEKTNTILVNYSIIIVNNAGNLISKIILITINKAITFKTNTYKNV